MMRSGGGAGSVEEGVEFDAEEGDFRGKILDCQGDFVKFEMLGG